MDLWLFYVRHVMDTVSKGPEEALEALKRRTDTVGVVDLNTAKDAVLNAHGTVTEAFELAVTKVGAAVNSASLWREYIAFLKRAPVCVSCVCEWCACTWCVYVSCVCVCMCVLMVVVVVTSDSSCVMVVELGDCVCCMSLLLPCSTDWRD